MTETLRILLLTGVLLMSSLSPLCAASPAAPDPVVTVLENGLTVLTVEDRRFPLASVRLYVRTGSAYEDPKQAGISHLLEHMVFKGTAKRGPGQAALDVEAAGGALNAATSFDYTVYYVDVPRDHWGLGLDVIGDMIFGAKVDDAELAQEKKVVLSELERGEDTPGQRLFKTVQQQLFAGTPYGWPIIGFRDTVQNVSRQDVLDYIAARYQPQSMVLVVVGDVDGGQVLEAARKQFGTLRNDRPLAPAAPLEPAPAAGPRVEVVPGKWNKVYLSMALPIPGLHSAEAAGLDVLAHLLGGDKTSRWYEEFKYKRRLVDDISASAMTLERGGVFYVSATLDAARLDEFWKAFAADLAALSAPGGARFDEQAIARARLNLEDDLFQAKETLSGLASKVGYFQFFEGGQQAEQNYLFQVRNADAAMLDSLVAAHLRPERLVAALLTPEGVQVSAAGLQAALATAWPVRNDAAGAAAAAAASPETVRLGRHTVVLLPDPTLPYTALSIAWPGGDGLSPMEEDGLPELAARVMTKGAGKRDARQIQTFLSDRAASLSVAAGRDAFSLSAKYPQRFEADLLGLVRDVALAPAWNPQEVAHGVEEQRAAIKSREDQPLGLAFRRIFPFLYAPSVYGRTHLGQPEALETFDAARLGAYWKRQSAQPFVLAACGVFDRAAVLELAKSLAKALPEAAPYAFEAPAFGSQRTLALNLPGRNQLHLLRIFPAVGQDHPDAAGLELLRAALAGQSGILFRDLRDKQGLGYSVTAFLWQAPRTGFMSFYIGTEPDKQAQALAGFDQAIANLRSTPLSAQDVERAVNQLEGDYYRDNQSLMARAGEASAFLARGLDKDYTRKLIDQAKTLTPADLQALARKYLTDDKAYLVTVAP